MTIVSQLINSRGNPAANHFVIQCKDGSTVLQSYNSLVAKVKGDEIILGPHWDYSATTLKHLKTFLNTSLSKKDIQKRIDAGEIVVTDITTD